MTAHYVDSVFYNLRYRQNMCDEVKDYSAEHIGYSGVTSIEYHEPQGPGDNHYVDIYYQDGHYERQFNINCIVFKPKEDCTNDC